MRQEITIVTCDRCHGEVEVSSVVDDTVNYRIEAMGWEVRDDEDICPNCLDFEEEEEDTPPYP